MLIRIFAALMMAAASLSVTVPAQAATVTSAQDLEGTPFARFLGSQDYRQIQVAAFARIDQAAGTICETGYRVTLTRLVVEVPVRMDDGDDSPQTGKWLERFRVNRCDEDVLFNTMAEVMPDGTLEVTPVAPGETAQPLFMIVELLPVLLPRAAFDECDQRILMDTRLGVPEGYEQDVADGVYETWTVQGCGRTVDLVLLFTPVSDGNVSIGIERQLPKTDTTN